MEILSVVLITLALVFYSLGIWAERIVRRLKAWHVVTFWIGFTFDVGGTLMMHRMADPIFRWYAPGDETLKSNLKHKKEAVL